MLTDRRAIALTPDQRDTVCSILDAVIPGAQVWVFGSRVTGRARPFSDLDLLVECPGHLDWQRRAELLMRFEASDLPFCVDIVDVEGLAQGFDQRVRQERLPLLPT